MRQLENYSGSVCEVKSLSNELLVAGHIELITDYYIQIISKDNFMPLYSVNTDVKVCIYNEVFGSLILMGKVYLSTSEFIRISDLQSVSAYEKRQYFRLYINLETKASMINNTMDIYPLDRSGFTVEVNQIDDQEYKTVHMEAQEHAKYNQVFENSFEVVINNLSLGGCSIKTNQRLERNQLVVVPIELYNKVYFFICKIVRAEKLEHQSLDFCFGAMFMNLTRSHEDMLCKYIFEQQRIQIQKHKEKTR